jgi:hypothetical protein
MQLVTDVQPPRNIAYSLTINANLLIISIMNLKVSKFLSTLVKYNEMTYIIKSLSGK